MARRQRVLWTAGVVGVALGVAVLVGVGCGGSAEPRILDVQPRKGVTTGDQPIKITGANFRPDIGYTIYFGNKRSPQVTIIDPQTILAVSPGHDSPGDVDITIRADDGNAWRIEKAFKYEEPASGPSQEQVGPTKGRY